MKNTAVIVDVDKIRIIRGTETTDELHIAEVQWLRDLPKRLLWTFDENEL